MTSQRVFRNRMGAALWIFALVWFAMLVAMTGVAIRDSASAHALPVFLFVVLGVFWLAGIGLVAYVATVPLIEVRIAEDRVTLVVRYPHRVVRGEWSASSLPPALLEEGRDSEGDRYWRVRWIASEGRSIDVCEGHDRRRCERVLDEFNGALAQARNATSRPAS